MAKITQHKIEQKKELTNINVTLCVVKHMFSDDFSLVLHEFSKEHYREPLKIFRQSWKIWLSNDEIQIKIQEETERMRKSNVMWTDEEIMKKIYTSARFYHRKKVKQDEKQDVKQDEITTKPKPYVGFTKDFIKLMDNKIKEQILQTSTCLTTNSKKKIIILNQTQSFHRFTLEHINEINEELGKLKNKYDEMNETFEPKNIALKLKKAYVNRFYLTSKILKI